MHKKINSYFLIFIILFSMVPVNADAPIKYYEIDSDIELRGAIFVNVDPTGFYASLNNGVIRIDSFINYNDVSVKFKGIALNSRLKKYNGFNVGYTHISHNGIITNELKPLEIDYQGFAYLNTDFSTVIINGMTGITTKILTGLSGNQSILVPNGSSYDLNITNNQPSIWLINGTGFSKRVLWTLNTTSVNLTNIPVERVTLYDSDMQIDMDDRQLTYYENDTLISFWDEKIINSINVTGYVNVPKTSTIEQQRYWHYYDNSTSSSMSDGDNTFDFFDSFLGSSLNTATKWNIISGSPIVNDGLYLNNGERINTKAWTGNSIIIKFKATIPDETGSTVFLLGGLYDNINQESLFITYFDWNVRSKTGAGNEITSIGAYDGEHTFKIIKNDGINTKFYIDNILKDTDSTYIPNTDIPILFGKTGSNNLLINWVFAQQYTSVNPQWLLDGEEQTASGIINITASVTGSNNTQSYNTSQSKEFTLTPTGTTNNININTTCTDYDATIITYWMDDTTQYNQTSDYGYVKSYINYTPSFNITTAIFNDTINLGIHNFSNDNYVGLINVTINDSYIIGIRNNQEINTTAYNLIKDIEYLINFTIPYNNIFILSNQSDTTAYLRVSKQFNDSSYNDPDNNPILSRLWNFGDSNNINTSNPTYIYNSLGVFNANYSVTENATTDSQTITKEFNVTVEVQPVQNLSSILEQTYINFNWNNYSSADYWNVSELEESIPYTNTSIILDGIKDSTYDCCAHGFIMYSPNPLSNTNYELILLFRNSTHLIGYAEGWDDDNLNNDDYFLIGIDGENNNLSNNDRKFILNEGGSTDAKRYDEISGSWIPTSTNSIGVVSGGGVAGQISYEMIVPISEIVGFVDNATIKFYMERECSYLNPTVETFYPLNLINSTDATIWKSVILTDGEVYNYIGNTSISEFNSTGLDIFSWNKHQFITINDTTESSPVYSTDITADIQHFTVSGYTKNTLGNIVSGVIVHATNGHVMEATQSDINGYYEGVNFHTGNYTIYGNKSGYQENFTNIYVTGNLTNQNVTLTAYIISDWEIYQQLLLIQSQNDEILLNISVNNTIVNDKIDTILIFILLNMAVIVGVIIGRRGKNNDN